MCLIIHAREGHRIPDALIESAAACNPHGYGIMVYDEARFVRVVRGARTEIGELCAAYAELAGRECVIHLRRRTRGAVDEDNTHPFRIMDHLYVAHNGTVEVEHRVARRSDTWHLVNDRLRPLLTASPDLIHDDTFQSALGGWMGIHNSAVFMDGARGKTVIINRDQGTDLDGLWLSNTRWFEAEQFGLCRATERPRRRGKRTRFAWQLSRYV